MSQHVNLANAKLNLSLKVVGRRSDGYHLLESLVVFLRLADDVEIGLAKKGCPQTNRIQLYGINVKVVPDNDKNIAWRALAIINKDIVKNLPEYTLSLTKRIPSGAGLGGGSADAATVIKAVAKKYNQHSDALFDYPWHQKLGSDVPICLYGRSCFVQGIGETVMPVTYARDVRKAQYVLLVMPKQSLSTEAVFARHAVASIPQEDRFIPAASVTPIDWDGIKSLGNDLYPTAVALCPEIAKLCQAMQTAEGCCYASMSGSGSTVFGLFDSLPLAYQAYRHMIDHPDGHWVCLTRMVDS
jgi:4-diphosphocytidyl-2-C-methyl-D-erythritol kinase